MSIHEKLKEIQTQIKAPKNLYNKFGNYKYRNAEGICEAVKPYLVQANCSLVLTDTIEMIGNRIYVVANATLTDCETGEQVFTIAYARESEEKKGMDASQITGTASSYARKYALNGLFLLDDTKDADTDEYHEQTNNDKKIKAPACIRCKNELHDVQRTDGTIMTAEQLKDFSLKKYKDVYCDKCMVQLEESMQKLKKGKANG